MSDLIEKKTTKREFLKILGVSSASLFASGSLADELLAGSQFGTRIPVAIMVKPNAFQLGRGDRFSTIIVFPRRYEVADVNVSSVRCEGARALKSVLRLDDRTIAVLYDIASLRNDLPCGFGTRLNVTGELSNGLVFQGSDEVTVIGADQNTVYHTSTRGRKSCNACKGYAANRIYSFSKAADLNRAHVGCNCRIVEEKIGWQDYVKAFWPDGPGGGVFYDKRWGWPPSSPTGLDLEYPSALKEHLRRV